VGRTGLDSRLVGVQVLGRFVKNRVRQGDVVDLAFEENPVALSDVVCTPASEAEHDTGTDIDRVLGFLVVRILPISDVEHAAVLEHHADVAELVAAAIAPEAERVDESLAVIPVWLEGERVSIFIQYKNSDGSKCPSCTCCLKF
jgi:hypothetical protein